MNPVTSTGNPYIKTFEASDAPLNLNAMSPEGMIAYVQEMLGETDGQINQMVSAMKDRKAQAAWLQQVAAEMRNAKNGTMSGELKKITDLRDQVQAKVDAANASGTPDPEAQKLLDQLNGMVDSLKANISSNGDHDMTSNDNDWLENNASKLDAMVSDLTSGTEIEMIQLQTLVEQRSHIISFVSKVVASMEDNVKNTIGNFR